jgi:mannose-1-phosphate guanylyltransferase
VQAVILVGGEGTRLRPLTATVPKPVVPLVDRPFIVYMLEWLRRHGVDDVIMSCGFLATSVRNVLGDGSQLGLRLQEDRTVKEFVEKPSADQIDTNLISAGAYVLERSVLDLIPPDRNVSIEREVWPRLVGEGLFGFAADAYWLDIGTPERYLQGTFDILEGNVETAVTDRLGADYIDVADHVHVHGRIIPPALVDRGCRIEHGAHVGSLVVLGEGVTVGAGSTIERAVVLNGTQIGPRCTLRDCIVAGGVRIGEGTTVSGGAVIGEGVTIGPHNVLSRGVRVFPQTELPSGAITF